MKRHLFATIFYCLFVATTMQSFFPVAEKPEEFDLPAIKEQLNNISQENVLFRSYVDAKKEKMIEREGVLIRRAHPMGTVVMCHGYLGSKKDTIALKHLFPHYNIFAFDFRAHGERKNGQISTIGRDEAFDVIAAVGVVKSDAVMSNKPVIAFGYSMGAVAAIQAQAMDEDLFDAMILDCPYDSTDNAMDRGLQSMMQISVFGKKITIPGRRFIINHMYDSYAQSITNFFFKMFTRLDSKKVTTKFVKVSPIEAIKKVTVPCFFIHCENDEKVPIAAVESIYANKPGFKRLWITQGTHHFGSYKHNPELYWYKINKFLNKLHSRSISDRMLARVCDQRTIKDEKMVMAL